MSPFTLAAIIGAFAVEVALLAIAIFGAPITPVPGVGL